MYRQETDSLKLQAASRVPVVASHVAHCCLDGLHVDRLWVFFVFLFLLPFCSATDCLRRRRRRRLGNWSCYVNCRQLLLWVKRVGSSAQDTRVLKVPQCFKSANKVAFGSLFVGGGELLGSISYGIA